MPHRKVSEAKRGIFGTGCDVYLYKNPRLFSSRLLRFEGRGVESIVLKIICWVTTNEPSAYIVLLAPSDASKTKYLRSRISCPNENTGMFVEIVYITIKQT